MKEQEMWRNGESEEGGSGNEGFSWIPELSWMPLFASVAQREAAADKKAPSQRSFHTRHVACPHLNCVRSRFSCLSLLTLCWLLCHIKVQLKTRFEFFSQTRVCLLSFGKLKLAEQPWEIVFRPSAAENAPLGKIAAMMREILQKSCREWPWEANSSLRNLPTRLLYCTVES